MGFSIYAAHRAALGVRNQSTEAALSWVFVRFLLKNLHFLLKNLHFLLKTVDFLLKNVDFIIKQEHEADADINDPILKTRPENLGLRSDYLC